MDHSEAIVSADPYWQ